MPEIVINAKMESDKTIIFDKNILSENERSKVESLVREYYSDFVSENNIKTEIIYPSIFRRKYKINVSYDTELLDIKVLDNLTKYSNNLNDASEEEMAKAVKSYTEDRKKLMKDHLGEYVIFKPKNDKYILHEDNNLSYDEWIKYDGISMKIGTEYEEQRSSYNT